jgi:hypothetical protein
MGGEIKPPFLIIFFFTNFWFEKASEPSLTRDAEPTRAPNFMVVRQDEQDLR